MIDPNIMAQLSGMLFGQGSQGAGYGGNVGGGGMGANNETPMFGSIAGMSTLSPEEQAALIQELMAASAEEEKQETQLPPPIEQPEQYSPESMQMPGSQPVVDTFNSNQQQPMPYAPWQDTLTPGVMGDAMQDTTLGRGWNWLTNGAYGRGRR